MGGSQAWLSSHGSYVTGEITGLLHIQWFSLIMYLVVSHKRTAVADTQETPVSLHCLKQLSSSF